MAQPTLRRLNLNVEQCALVTLVSLALLGAAAGGCGSSTSDPTGDGGSAGRGATSATGGNPANASGGNGAPTGGSGAGGGPGLGGSPGTGGAAGPIGGTGGSGAGGAAGSSASGGSGGAGGAGATGGAGGGGSATGGAGGTACPGAAYDPASPPQALMLSGNLGAHDPAAYVVGNTIYLAATGITTKSSTNLTSWTGWSASGNPHAGAWAPDISNFGGVFHLYYAVSTFGSNKSCIGQETRAALDTGAWAEQGNVLCSNMGTTDDWNAIDPNIVLDDAGVPWMVFGSFWGGIKMVKLKTDGTRADTMLYDIAKGANGGTSVEGAFIFKRCGTYYLFVSWGSCCSSPYNYRIVVGRSQTVSGPYVDKDAKSMLTGGGTLLVQGNANWSAPGHNAVIAYNNRTYNVYHALAAPSGQDGTATLRIAELVWDANGWPVSGGP